MSQQLEVALLAFGTVWGLVTLGAMIVFAKAMTIHMSERRSKRAVRRNSGRVRVITGDPDIDASQLASNLRRQMSRRYSA